MWPTEVDCIDAHHILFRGGVYNVGVGRVRKDTTVHLAPKGKGLVGRVVEVLPG